MVIENLQFFDKDGYNLNFDWNYEYGYWEGNIYLPKVSVGIYANTTIYVLEEINDVSIDNENNQFEVTGSVDNSIFDSNFVFPYGSGDITFEWDRLNKFVDEFFMFTFDETYISKESSSLTYTPNDGPDCETLIVNRFDKYSVNLENKYISKPLPIHIAFMANEKYDATTYTRTLVMSYNGSTVARIKLYAETVEEDERLKIWNDNLGYNITPEDAIIFKNSDIKEYKPNYILLNEKRKELMMEGSNIYPYVGSYKAIINAIKFFGYENLNIIEYWKNVNKNDENFGKIYHSSKYSLTNKETLKIGVRNIKLPNKDYKKINCIALVYSINTPTGELDEFDLPKVKEEFSYTIEEVLIKLFALRKKLNKEFMPGSSRIIDIIGEANYFGLKSIRKIGDKYSHYIEEYKYNPSFEIYPNKYLHITDNTYFGRYINKSINTSEFDLSSLILSDIINEKIEDLDGYLNGIKIYDINSLLYGDNYLKCELYKKYYDASVINNIIYEDNLYSDDNPNIYYDDPHKRFSAKCILKNTTFNHINFGNCDLKFNCEVDSIKSENNMVVKEKINLDNATFDTIDDFGKPNLTKWTISFSKNQYDGDLKNIGIEKNYNLNYNTNYIETSIEDFKKDVFGEIMLKNGVYLLKDGIIVIDTIDEITKSQQYEDSDSDSDYEYNTINHIQYEYKDNVIFTSETYNENEIFVELPFIGYYDVTMEIGYISKDDNDNDKYTYTQEKTMSKYIKVDPYQINLVGFYYDANDLPKIINYDMDDDMKSFIEENTTRMYNTATIERIMDYKSLPKGAVLPFYDRYGNITEGTNPYYNTKDIKIYESPKPCYYRTEVNNVWCVADNVTEEITKLEPITKYTRYIRNGVDVKPYTWFLLGYDYSKITGKVEPHWYITNETLNETIEFEDKRYLTLLLKKEGNYNVRLELKDKNGNTYEVSRNIIVVKKSANYNIYQTFKKDYDYYIEQKTLMQYNEQYENDKADID